jgi:hypothetical protein
MQLAFGSGSLWGVSTSQATPTPNRFGVTQSIDLSVKATNKTLFGQYRLPIAVGGGPISVTGKCGFAQFDARLMSDLFFAGALATGQTTIADGEAQTVPAATPFAVTAANSATWTQDLGVIYAATGKKLVKVAAAPTQGQYAVAAGVYTLAAADANAALKISYLYTTTTGQTLTISNSLMGTAPAFKATASMNFNGNNAVITLNQCIGENLDLKTALEDFTKPEFGFGAFVDASNTLGFISLAEAL